MIRAVISSALVVGLLLAMPAGAQAPDAQAREAIIDMDVVHGVQPGPGLWKVSRGEHVLWILGTLGPLPSEMQWRSNEVENVIEHSQQILAAPTVVLEPDVGFFGKLALLPSVRKVMKNEDGARLQEVLPADLYARWSLLKARYLGNDKSVEKKRPMIAAGELYQAAMRKSGLGGKSVVWPVITRAAKQAGIEPTRTKLEFKITEPKSALKELRADGIDDIACFRSMLDAVENDLPTMVERANAWALGDIQALQAMPPRADAYEVCMDALSTAEFARKRGLEDLPGRLREHWMQIAGQALERNAVTFAVLPLAILLGEDGYLARLQGLGYEIQAP